VTAYGRSEPVARNLNERLLSAKADDH